jgi:pimeloyl-ACP methyl ester carboxylesterase
MECRVSKGIIYYEVCGEGRPIVVLHAMGTDHQSMKSWLEPMFTDENNWKRVYVDIPAHGKSTITDQVKGTEDMLDMIIEFIDTVLPNQCISVIGMSFGGYLAQGIVHKKREFINGVCLIASALHLPGKERKLPAKVVYEEDKSLFSELHEDICNAFQYLMVYQNKSNLITFLTEVQPGRLLANREFLASEWRKENYYYQFEPFDNVEKLTQPTLIVLGKHDSIAGYEDHIHLLRKFSQASFTVLDEAGHMIQIEQRATLMSLVTEWLFRIEK